MEKLKTRQRKKEKLIFGKNYKVLILNDNYTPMNIVTELIMKVFHHSPEKARAIMLQAHNSGVGLCGAYNWDIANTKAGQMEAAAAAKNYPLQCIVEEE